MHLLKRCYMSIAFNRIEKSGGSIQDTTNCTRYPGRSRIRTKQSAAIPDETGLLACAAYVDLNPIRAALVEFLDESGYTSVQRRISPPLLKQQQDAATSSAEESSTAAERPDRFLSPLTIDELRDEIGVNLNRSGD